MGFMRIRIRRGVRIVCKAFTWEVIGVLDKHFDKDLPLIGAEVGVAQGLTSVSLLQWFLHLRLYMIDKYKVGELRQDLNECMMHAKVSTDFARDRRMMIIGHSLEAARLIPDESLDFVFVDANHYYDYVMRDLEAWFPKVKPGGILIGHDYDAPRHEQEMKRWGVKKAVDDFVRREDLQLQVMKHLVWWVKRDGKLKLSTAADSAATEV